MKLIKFMGQFNFYVFPNENIPLTVEKDNHIWNVQRIETYKTEMIKHSDVTRPLIVTSMPDASQAFIRYLFWYTKTNLEEIDRKVLASIETEIDFTETVITYYQIVTCVDNCLKRWHALVGERTDILISDPPHQNLQRLSRVNKLNCPNCGMSFRIPVLKIFEEYIEPEKTRE